MSADPWFRPYVSFRTQPNGGSVRREPEIHPDDALSGDRVILLIHGYNNDRDSATASYRGAAALQQQLGGFPGKLVAVYWPGDNWENFAFYMQSIGHAVDTAAALARELRKAARSFGLLRISIAAHSMGCRVAFELLRELHNSHENIVVERLAIMAAAVPTFSLEPPGSRARPLRAAFDKYLPSPEVLSLFSGADPVLRFAFPLGQSLAGEGLFPVALGHSQWNGTGAMHSPPLTQAENRGARHGDYWKGTFAQQKVTAFLNASAAPPRVVASSAPPARVTEPPRETPARAIG